MRNRAPTCSTRSTDTAPTDHRGTETAHRGETFVSPMSLWFSFLAFPALDSSGTKRTQRCFLQPEGFNLSLEGRHASDIRGRSSMQLVRRLRAAADGRAARWIRALCAAAAADTRTTARRPAVRSTSL